MKIGEMADGILPEPAPPAPTDPRLPLNARQVFKLKKSWKGIKRNMASTGLEMFVRMFRSNQDTIQLFSKFKDFTTEDEMRLSDNLEMHGSKVMEIIDETISNVENVDYIFELLSTTGKMHNNFTGFTSNMFWRIEEPFLKAVMITLGDRYSDQMDCIYKIVIHLILEKLIDGMNSGSTDNST